MKFWCLSILLLFCLEGPVDGQYMINYSIKEGLSSYNLKGLLQDRYGFIWIGTQDGLNRFDGKEFDVFNKLAPAGHRLLHNHVKAMLINGDSLWVSTALGGVNIIDTRLNKVLNAIAPETNNGMSHWVEDMQLDASKDNLWMSGFEGLISYSIKTRAIRSWKKNPFLPGSTMVCRRFIFLSDSLLLLNIEDFGFAVFNTVTEKFEILYPFAGFQIPNQGHLIVNSLTRLGRRLFVGSTNGVFAFEQSDDQGHLQQATDHLFKEVLHEEIKDISLYNNLLYVSCSKGLFIYEKNGMLNSAVTQANSMIDDEKITGSLVDRDKNLWIASYSGLHLQNRSDIPYVLKSQFQNAALKNVATICTEAHGNLLVCTWNGLFFYDKQHNDLRHITYHNQPSIGAYYDVWQLPGGSYIASSQAGNYALVKRSSGYVLLDSAETNEKWPVPKNFIFSSSLKLSTGEWLFGSEFENGLTVSNGTSYYSLDTSSKPLTLSENSINKLFVSRDSLIWVLYDNSIDVIDWRNKSLVNIKVGRLPQAPDDKIFFGIEEAAGKIWIGTYGGGLLYMDEQTRDWKKMTTAEGLCNNSIYTVTKEDENHIWVSTNAGLSRINTRTLKTGNFFSQNDYLAFAFDERSSLKTDSSFFFGGPAGLIEIFPDRINGDSAVPKIYITGIGFSSDHKLKRYSDIGITELEVPYDSPYLEMDLSCINFNSPELNTFYYRLNSNNDWVNLGTNNKIRLPNFEPGTYKFEVRAASKNGVYSQPASLKIIIHPPWYNTWWFKLLVLSAVAGIVYAFYRYRINVLKKQHEIRKSIATDLHDDLGSTLNSVKVFTNLAIRGINQPESLQQIRENLNEATMGLRDMIWVLDDSLDTIDEFITRLKQYTIPLAQACGINISIKADTTVNFYRLTKAEKRNLFLICKEAINNSIKYSGATQIDLDITPGVKKFKIIFGDNGTGFDPATVKKGYGIKNMQYRGAQIKYRIQLTSAPGRGTQLVITPL